MRHLLAIMLLILVSIPAFAQEEVDVPLPDIPPGQQVIVTYQVTVNDTLLPNVTVISDQGVITGSNFGPVYTDDPATVSNGDATLTQLGFNLNVDQLPNTGEAPWWRIPVMVGAALAAVTMLFFGVKTVKQS
jgi:hypothetical protein